jgi:hypothetical protein
MPKSKIVRSRGLSSSLARAQALTLDPNVTTRTWRPRHTGQLARRLVLAVTMALGAVAACASTPRDTYKGAITKEEACCSHLTDGSAREACLGRIERLESAAARADDINRQTFGCIERHFVCDPATGTSTQASAQAQLDCVSELESTGT